MMLIIMLLPRTSIAMVRIRIMMIIEITTILIRSCHDQNSKTAIARNNTSNDHRKAVIIVIMIAIVIITTRAQS